MEKRGRGMKFRGDSGEGNKEEEWKVLKMEREQKEGKEKKGGKGERIGGEWNLDGSLRHWL